jgi:ATP-dependent DNA helicase RecG
MRLDTQLVKVLGDKTAKPLEDSLRLRTVGDLLHHYPFRYFQHGALTDLGDLEVGDHVTVLARVKTSGAHVARNGKKLGKVVVTDGTGTLELAFFGKVAAWQTERLKPGSEHLFAGVISEFRGSSPTRRSSWAVTTKPSSGPGRSCRSTRLPRPSTPLPSASASTWCWRRPTSTRTPCPTGYGSSEAS